MAALEAQFAALRADAAAKDQDLSAQLAEERASRDEAAQRAAQVLRRRTDRLRAKPQGARSLCR